MTDECAPDPAAALAEAQAEVERLRADRDFHREAGMSHMMQAFENGAAANALRVQIAALTAAARRLLDGASGNGSRMTVSKSDHDRLVDVLHAALAQSSAGGGKR